MESVYACRNCDKNGISTPIVKAEVPKPVIPGSGMASPSIRAYIVWQKYGLGLLLYRQEQELKGKGIPLRRQTLANWMIHPYEPHLSRLMDHFEKELLRNEILHADETTVQVLREDGKRAESKSYMWLYRTSQSVAHQVVLYEYASTRSKKIPLKRLESYKGYLHTDGYDVYHSLPNVKNVGCWAHMRRKFTDVLKGLSAENQKTAHANIGLRYCNRLFALEKSYLEAELTAEERLQARLENSKPIAEEFLAWAKAIAPRTPPRSCFGQAITYALNQEEYLMNVFLDGRLELSNNIAENSIRPFAVGRKN